MLLNLVLKSLSESPLPLKWKSFAFLACTHAQAVSAAGLLQ